MNKKHWYIPITIVFLFLGILLSLQFQAQTRFASDLAFQKTETLIAMVRGLSEKRQKLALEIIDLGNQLRSQMESTQDEKKLLESIGQQMEKLNIVNGTTDLKGPGLTITLEEYNLIYYTDLLNIVNELWNAGAEAISINEHRVTDHTTFSYIEYNFDEEIQPFFEENYMRFITIDHKKLDFPITIKALGNSNNLEKGLTLPGGVMDNLALSNTYPELEKKDKLTIPALQSPPTYFFLSEYNPPADSNNNHKPNP